MKYFFEFRNYNTLRIILTVKAFYQLKNLLVTLNKVQLEQAVFHDTIQTQHPHTHRDIVAIRMLRLPRRHLILDIEGTRQMIRLPTHHGKSQ